MQLTPHFSLAELSASQAAARHGIDNAPPDAARDALRALAWQVLEPCRAAFGRPLHVSSGYRSPKLNALVGGALNSQHLAGTAADFEVLGVANADVAAWIAATLVFDQLILEAYTPGQPNSGWIHCSFGASNRRSVLTWNRQMGYRPGLIR